MIDIVFQDGDDFVALVADATPEHRHRMSAVVSEYERERGTNAVDHVRAERIPFTVEAVFSDTPLDGSVVLTRCAEVWAQLRDAMARSLVATVTTRLATYTEMVLTEALTTQTAADGSWIRVELTFQECPTVSSETVDDPVPARVRDHSLEERGDQTTTIAPEQTTSFAQAIQDQLPDWVRGRRAS